MMMMWTTTSRAEPQPENRNDLFSPEHPRLVNGEATPEPETTTTVTTEVGDPALFGALPGTPLEEEQPVGPDVIQEEEEDTWEPSPAVLESNTTVTSVLQEEIDPELFSTGKWWWRCGPPSHPAGRRSARWSSTLWWALFLSGAAMMIGLGLLLHQTTSSSSSSGSPSSTNQPEDHLSSWGWWWWWGEADPNNSSSSNNLTGTPVVMPNLSAWTSAEAQLYWVALQEYLTVQVYEAPSGPTPLPHFVVRTAPQFRALQWMVIRDPLAATLWPALVAAAASHETVVEAHPGVTRSLIMNQNNMTTTTTLNDTNSTTSTNMLLRRQILQRYALAVLYFSWNGDQVWSLPDASYGWPGYSSRRRRPVVSVSSSTSSSSNNQTTNSTVNDVDQQNIQGSSDNQPNSTGDATRSSTSWADFMSECSWLGIQCQQDQVVGLDLSGDEFMCSGRVPVELGILSALQVLHLANNALQGRLPSELFTRLTALTDLDLSVNRFTGHLDPGLAHWTRLQHLQWNLNLLSGPLDTTALQSLTALRTWGVQGNNHLTGPIWELAASSWSQIESIDVSYTGLSGAIVPAAWAAALAQDNTTVDHGSESATPMMTTLPPLSSAPLGHWPYAQLTSLMAAASVLTGTIPTELGLLAPKLNKLSLNLPQGAKVGGTMPWQYAALTQLNFLGLQMGGYQVQGTMPAIWGSTLTNLTVLDVSGNTRLTGPIPEEFGNMTDLELLRLSYTALSGTIPSTLSRCTDLQFLYLIKTELSGSMPSAVCNLPHLSELSANCRKVTASDSPQRGKVYCPCCNDCESNVG